MTQNKDEIRQELIRKGLLVPSTRPVRSTSCEDCSARFEYISDRELPEICPNCEYPDYPMRKN